MTINYAHFIVSESFNGDYSDGKNCLTNSGSYIASWSEDYTGYIGQTITVDEQCRLAYGDNYYYAVSFILYFTNKLMKLT